jgi:site-specific recombinase XerD
MILDRLDGRIADLPYQNLRRSPSPGGSTATVMSAGSACRASCTSSKPITARSRPALRRLKREQLPASLYFFTTERRGPITAADFHKQLAWIGQAALLPLPVYPHMLRHACGFKLANDGHGTRAIQEYPGHSNTSTPPATPS